MTIKFYSVFYTTDGSVHLIPADSKEEAETTIKNILNKPRGKEVCKETAVIKRNIDNYPGGYIFGTRGLNVADTTPVVPAASVAPANSPVVSDTTGK